MAGTAWPLAKKRHLALIATLLLTSKEGLNLNVPELLHYLGKFDALKRKAHVRYDENDGEG